MPKARAEELAETFFSRFGDGSLQFFTNRLPWRPSVYERAAEGRQSGIVVIREDEVEELGWGQTDGPWTYSGLTKSTFDSGLVVVDSRQAGILWFEDED